MTAEELRRIEQDVAAQETLIAGYQKENERLTLALKAARDERRVEAARADDEARKLSLRISELQRGVPRRHAHAPIRLTSPSQRSTHWQPAVRCGPEGRRGHPGQAQPSP